MIVHLYLNLHIYFESTYIYIEYIYRTRIFLYFDSNKIIVAKIIAVHSRVYHLFLEIKIGFDRSSRGKDHVSIIGGKLIIFLSQ